MRPVRSFSEPFCRGRLRRKPRRRAAWLLLWTAVAVSFGGCGTTKSYEATQQLLLSEAVDQSVAAIDFRPLTGQKVYFDTAYIKSIKTPTLVNADYVISALRQQIAAAGCLLQAKEEEADIVIEARLGALGADGFQITYGMPPNSLLSSAAALIPGAPQVPSMPELSLARRETTEGAAKVAAFAYDRVTREPLWQSGTARAMTSARDAWILGVGPLQSGTIRSSKRWVGSGLRFAESGDPDASPPLDHDRPPVNYDAQVRFNGGQPVLGEQSGTAVGSGAAGIAQQGEIPAVEVPATQVAEQPSEPAEPAPAVQR